MQLHQIEHLDRQVLEAALDEGGQVLAVVAVGDVRVEPASRLGRDDDGLATFPAQAREQALAVTITVDVGGIEEIHPQIHGAMEGRK